MTYLCDHLFPNRFLHNEWLHSKLHLLPLWRQSQQSERTQLASKLHPWASQNKIWSCLYSLLYLGIHCWWRQRRGFGKLCRFSGTLLAELWRGRQARCVNEFFLGWQNTHHNKPLFDINSNYSSKWRCGLCVVKHLLSFSAVRTYVLYISSSARCPLWGFPLPRRPWLWWTCWTAHISVPCGQGTHFTYNKP